MITNDKDFGEKVYRERHPHHGVVFLRLADDRAATKITTLRRLLAAYANQLSDRFVAVTERQIRFGDEWIMLFQKDHSDTIDTMRHPLVARRCVSKQIRTLVANESSSEVIYGIYRF